MRRVLAMWSVGRIIGLLLFCAVAGQALGQARDWVKEMFKESTHDFGVVARGAKVEYSFVVENNNEEDIRIESVSSSCGCSTPRVTKQVLKSWETAEIVVTLDTRGFTGRKDATITVKFSPPYAAEFQLHVHAYIRSDIVVQPGAVEFGSVSQGAGAQKTLAINYAGRNDWKIEQVQCTDPHIETSLVETGRTPGQVNYSLAVKLKQDAPPGYIRDQLTLVTNDIDAHAARVPVVIEGLVASATYDPTLAADDGRRGGRKTGHPQFGGSRSDAIPHPRRALGRRPFPVQSVYGSEGRAYPARHLSRQGRHFRRRAALREDPH